VAVCKHEARGRAITGIRSVQTVVEKAPNAGRDNNRCNIMRSETRLNIMA
jgi:hypothetical protein